MKKKINQRINNFISIDLAEIKGLFVNVYGIPLELTEKELDIKIGEIRDILLSSFTVFLKDRFKEIIKNSTNYLETKAITVDEIKKLAKDKYNIEL